MYLVYYDTTILFLYRIDPQYAFGIVRSDAYLGEPLKDGNTNAFLLEHNSQCQNAGHDIPKLGQFGEDSVESVFLLSKVLMQKLSMNKYSCFTMVIFDRNSNLVTKSPKYTEQKCMRLYEANIILNIPCSRYMIYYRGTIAEFSF